MSLKHCLSGSALCILLRLNMGLLVVAQSGPAIAIGETITCVDLQAVGVCVFITCIPFPPACKVKSSVKIRHFNPDVDVILTKPLGAEMTEQAQRIDTHNRNHNNTIFHDGSVTGNVLAGRFYCPSQARPLFPYFVSGLDIPEWRLGLFDAISPNALIPGLREIGHWPLNTWGNLFPRNGWTTQSSAPKAAAVTAQRIGNIITQVGAPHVYVPLTGSVSNGTYVAWAPGELMENSNVAGYWQSIYPVFETGCVVFGGNDTHSLTDWGGGRVSSDGTYVQTLWRPYSCCRRAGLVFLSSFDF